MAVPAMRSRFGRWNIGSHGRDARATWLIRKVPVFPSKKDRDQRGQSNKNKRDDPNTARTAKHDVFSFDDMNNPTELPNQTKPARQISRIGPTISRDNHGNP
jgi:hypothetical protein